LATKYLRQSAGDVVETTTVATSSGAGDQDKIPSLDSTGRLDQSFIVGSPSALQLLRVNAAGTALEAYTSPVQRTAIATSVTPAASAQTPFASSLNITSGKAYEYTIRLWGKPSTGTPTVTLQFNAGGSAASNLHRVSLLRQSPGTVTVVAAEQTSLAILTTVSFPSAALYLFEISGVLEATGTGTLTLQLTPSASTITFYRGSTWVMTEVA